MIIVHYDGQGIGLLSGVTEYIELFESEEDFIDDDESKEAAIETHCAPGFTLAGYYDTDVDTEFHRLPMDRTLIPTL